MSDELAEMVTQVASTRRKIDAGTFLFHQGEPVRTVYQVVTGGVQLVRHQPDGSVIILQRAGPGAILAEASLFADYYHCDAVASAPSSLLGFSRRMLRSRLKQTPKLAEAWCNHLAREVQAARTRAEILSLKTVAERLDAWIAANQRGHPIKGEWKTVATEIAVSPEALYREMAKRRTSQHRRWLSRMN